MNSHHRPLLRPSILAAAASLALPLAASATTTLTFGGFVTNAAIPATFADFATTSGTGYTTSPGVQGITGTPNIDIGWTATSMQYYNDWETAGNSVFQTELTTNVPMTLSFSPSAGYGVLIQSFLVDLWTGGGTGTYTWSVTAGATTLASGSLTLTNNTNAQVNTGITLAQAQAVAGLPVNLNLTMGAGLAGSYLAIDNLVFDQVNPVPEPSGVALAGLALGAAALRRRRRA